ncbi:hypothetical protein CJF31_00002363 [Rutstroemia sp. NJR-2017a BVV2]|nr:hypothetical protein CJF31_00002363 [Rutstroemia sp. NJR-2017a BVV2]
MGNCFAKTRDDGKNFKVERAGVNRLVADFQEGGFTQRVHIYSRQDSKVVKRGTVLLDPGNNGPNLITDDAMRYVHGQPTGPGITIRTYDGEESELGGEVKLCFSGPGPKKRYYEETFRHVPHIADGYDMVLNHDFHVKVYPKMIPTMLMIRAGGKKESEGIICLEHSLGII